MYQGIIKKIIQSEGYGFIIDKNGNLIKFLLSAVIGVPVAEEDKVEYDVIDSNGNKMAVRVSKIVSDSPDVYDSKK